MSRFSMDDNHIEVRQILYTLPSMIIGIGILSVPRTLASVTSGTDGVISIVIGGIYALCSAILIVLIAKNFKDKGFFDYISLIISKPLAAIVTLIFAAYGILFTSSVSRTIGEIARAYMFDRTPTAVLVFAFLLVVIYSACSPLAALLRLNLMFFPIVFGVSVFAQFWNIPFMESNHFAPYFKTSWLDIFKGSMHVFFSFLGFEILFFYTPFIKDKKKVVKVTFFSMLVPIFLYTIIYISCIGVFANAGTENMLFPTVELSKEVEVPGAFFEHFEAIFFIVWTMTIFNTAAMGFSIVTFSLSSMFKKVKKKIIVFLTAPIIFFIAMVPKSIFEVEKVFSIIGYMGIFTSIVLPTVLFVMMKLRGIKNDG